jgi:DNA-binding transcriptional LysR family regulator
MPPRIDWESRIGRRLKLRDLHVYFAVVECGSMAKAATELGVSQPTVSEVIADLEHTFGVRLLDRSPRGIEPTMYGSALLKRGTAAFDELKQSGRDIEFLADPTVGELKIGCAESIAAAVLPAILERFVREHPRVVVHIDDVPSPAVGVLRERKHDLIMARTVGPLREEPDFNVEILFEDELVIATGAHSRWGRHRKIDHAELVDVSWILSPPESWAYARVTEAFQARGLKKPKISFITLSVHLRNHLLADGRFVSGFPKSIADRYAQKVLPVDLPVRGWPVVIVTLKNRTLSPVVERFIECSRGWARSLITSSRRRIR